jgi:1-acyl-sn-glycerol-3-phosphate acyltransferase
VRSALASVASGGAGVVRAGARLASAGATAAIIAARARSIRQQGGRARDRARALRDGCGAVLRHHGIVVEVDGLPPQGPALLACNHVSWLDPIVVAAHATCAPISKLDVRGWPVVGTLAGRLGVIFHERGSPRSGVEVLRQAEQALRNRVALLNFPEGTTTDGAGVLRFRRGLFGLALQLSVPVVPVALRYQPADLAWTGDATFMPHYLRLAARGTSRVRLRFGEPIEPGAYPTATGLADAVRDRVAALLEAL